MTETDDRECPYCGKDDFESKHARDVHVAYKHTDESEIPQPKKRRKKKHSILDDFEEKKKRLEEKKNGE